MKNGADDRPYRRPDPMPWACPLVFCEPALYMTLSAFGCLRLLGVYPGLLNGVAKLGPSGVYTCDGYFPTCSRHRPTSITCRGRSESNISPHPLPPPPAYSFSARTSTCPWCAPSSSRPTCRSTSHCRSTTGAMTTPPSEPQGQYKVPIGERLNYNVYIVGAYSIH